MGSSPAAAAAPPATPRQRASALAVAASRQPQPGRTIVQTPSCPPEMRRDDAPW